MLRRSLWRKWTPKWLCASPPLGRAYASRGTRTRPHSLSPFEPGASHGGNTVATATNYNQHGRLTSQHRQTSQNAKRHLTEPTPTRTHVHQDVRAAPLRRDRGQSKGDAHHDEERINAALLHQLPMLVPAVDTHPSSILSFFFKKTKKEDKQTRESIKRMTDRTQKHHGTIIKTRAKTQKGGGGCPTKPPTAHQCRTQRAHR